MTHRKATVKVGRDEFTDMEFFVDDPGETYLRNWAREDKWYESIWYSLVRAKRKIKHYYFRIRYGFERMFKGYDSEDIFEMYAGFVERYTKIFTRYKKTHCGYPDMMTEEEWENIIDEMLYHLHYMDENNVDNELQKGVPDDWIPTTQTTDIIMGKHKDEFFTLFSKYFYNLWD